MSIIKSIKQQLGLGPAAENHFWDGNVANQLSLRRGTPDAPGTTVMQVVDDGVVINGRISGPPTAGQIGEVLIFTPLNPSPSSSSFATIGSISLPAGVWLLIGTMSYTITTGPSQMRSCGFGTTGTTMDYGTMLEQYISSGGFSGAMPLPNKVVSLNTTTTLYAVGRAAFTGGTMSLSSSCFAVRIA